MTDIAALRAQLDEIKTEQAAAFAAISVAPPPTPLTGTTSGLDATTLAARSFVREFGISELEARQSIGTSERQVPLEALHERIAAEDARVLAIMQADEDAAAAASPEGMEAAAEAARLARQQAAHRAGLARESLIDRGIIRADEADSISDAEALQAAGFNAPDLSFFEGANDLAANRAVMATTDPIAPKGADGI